MSVSKIKQPSDLWERCEGKLMVYIMEGISLVTKHGAGNPFVKLVYDKQKHKTQICKHAEDASWKELFWFEVVDDQAELVLEVHTKSGLSEKLIGSCTVCIPTELRPEELIDRVVDLELPANLKSKHKEALDSRMGNIHLRLIYSREHEVPLRPPPNDSSNFYYREHYRNMQTGDLILYSGIGSTDSVCKLLSGTRYSRVGMVVRLPNKWTGVEKLYVFEVSRNLGRELDAFKETATPGASFFRLFEHIHAVAATDIWWVPLKMPLEPASCANMVDWIKEVVARRISVEFPAVPAEVSDMFDRYEFSLHKHPMAVAEICSASAMAAALRLGGKRVPFDIQFLSCVQLMSQDCFGDPIVIRERSEVAMPPFLDIPADSISRASSSSMRRSTIHVSMTSNGGSPTETSKDSSASTTASDNEVIAPKVRSVSQAPEPLRATSSQALLRQDPTPFTQTFSAQHMHMAPHQMGHMPVMHQPDHNMQYQQPPPYGYYPPQIQQPNEPITPQETDPNRAYRAPSNGPMPISPPGPSVIGLPTYTVEDMTAQNGARGEANADLVPPTDTPPVPGVSHSPRKPDDAVTVNQEVTHEHVVVEAQNGHPIQIVAVDPSPEPGSKSSESGEEKVTEPEMLVVVKPVDAEPKVLKSPSNSELAAAGAPPPQVTAPKPKPKMTKEKSLKGRPHTANSKDLHSEIHGTADSQRTRSGSSGEKPRLLPAPSGRNVGSATLGGPVERHRLDGEHSPRESPPTPTVLLTPDTADAPVDELVSPRKKSRKSERGEKGERHTSPRSPRSSRGDESTVAASSDTPPTEKRKKRSKKVEEPEGENGNGPAPPLPEKKKKKKTFRSSRMPAPAHEDAIREDLDETTKTEIRKRRAGSIRIIPSTESAAQWNAAVNGKSPAEEKLPEPAKEEAKEIAAEQPSEVVTLPTFRPKNALVLWTFDAMSENELTVHEGEKVTVLGISEEWCLVDYNGKRGAVPVSFLSIDP